MRRNQGLCGWLVVVIGVVVVTLIQQSSGYSTSLSNADPYHHEEVLGPDGNYTLEWRVHWKTREIFFNVSAECKGYIGLGLSRNGGIHGADFVVGGVTSKGIPYISDMHGITDGSLEKDRIEDWNLISANRTGGRLYLSFSRKFSTCDLEEDIEINDDLTHLIWIYGDTDEVTLSFPHIGTHRAYLLDPNQSSELALRYYRELGPHSNLYLMQSWRVSTQISIPPRSSGQVCSVIRGQTQLVNTMHYVLGGGAYLPHEAGDYVRQIILSRCQAAPGINQTLIFGPLAERTRIAEECGAQSITSLPRQLCTQKIFVWGHGGQPFYFPDEFGIPIGGTPDEYFMLEVQYSNLDSSADVSIKAGFELMVHPRPKANEVGILTIGYTPDSPFVIPPQSPSFTVTAHCSPQCTRANINETLGIVAGAVQMHGYGYGALLKQYRGSEELPWVIKDDNYDPTFQQIRMLPKLLKVQPGDQLTLQCTYDSTNSRSPIVSGSSGNMEQCTAHLFVTPPVNAAWCSSEYPSSLLMNQLGIEDTRTLPKPRRIGAPANLASINPSTLAASIEKSTRWSVPLSQKLEKELTFGSHTPSCPSRQELSSRSSQSISRGVRGRITKTEDSLSSSVTFPFVSKEYRPVSNCKK